MRMLGLASLLLAALGCQIDNAEYSPPRDGMVAGDDGPGNPAGDLGTPVLSDGGGTDLTAPATGAQSPPYPLETSSTTEGDATFVAFVPVLPGAAKAPLVIWKHGFQLATSNYEALLRAVAEQGFVVIGVDTAGGFFNPPSNVDEQQAMLAGLDWALKDAPFASRVDVTRVAVGGHSRGGKVAVMAAAADDRVDAVLLLDPVNGCGPGQGYSDSCPDITQPAWAGALALPVGVMGETNNAKGGLSPCAPEKQNYATIFKALTKATWAVSWTFTGADHMDFTDDGGGVVGGLCADGPGDDATIRKDVRALALAFFLRHLLGQNASDAVLTGASLPAGIVVEGP